MPRTLDPKTLTIDLRMFRHSGIGRYLRNIIPLVLPLVDAPHICILADPIVLGSPPSWLTHPGLRLHATSAPIYGLAEQALPFSLPPTNLLWVPHYNAPLLYRGLLLLTIHDIAHLALPSTLDSPLKRAYAALLIRRSIAHAAHILTISRFTRSELTTRLHVPGQKITLAPLGLDADWPTFAPPHVEADAVPYLLFVGNVKPNKNLALLLQALKQVHDRIPHRLVIAGRLHGFSTGDEAVLAAARAFGDRVRFAGEIDDATLQSLYAGASALVMPSLYEGFGLPLLEAMQLGCPVLSSSAASLPEVGGDAPIYFRPDAPEELAAAILQLLDPATVALMRQHGYARLAHFSFDRCAQQTASVINHLLHSAAG